MATIPSQTRVENGRKTIQSRLANLPDWEMNEIESDTRSSVEAIRWKRSSRYMMAHIAKWAVWIGTKRGVGVIHKFDDKQDFKDPEFLPLYRHKEVNRAESSQCLCLHSKST